MENRHAVHIDVEMEKEMEKRKSNDIQQNLMVGCGRLPQPEWFSQTHLKKTIPYVRAYLRSADTRAWKN